MTKTIKQDKQTASLVATMVASAVADKPEVQAPAAVVDTTVLQAAEKIVAVTKAQKPKTPKVAVVKAVKPTKAAKKAVKVEAKKAVAKAQESAKESTAIRSPKQGLTFGQWLKLLVNTAAVRSVKIPATEAGLTKKFQPVYMAGSSVKEALA